MHKNSPRNTDQNNHTESTTSPEAENCQKEQRVRDVDFLLPASVHYMNLCPPLVILLSLLDHIYVWSFIIFYEPSEKLCL